METGFHKHQDESIPFNLFLTMNNVYIISINKSKHIDLIIHIDEPEI